MSKSSKPFLQVLRLLIPIILTLLWLCFIFGNSLQTGAASGSASGKVHAIINAIPEALGLGSPVSHYFVRKAAHFTEFAILTFFICSDLICFRLVSLKQSLKRSLPILSAALPMGIICAVADELLQNVSKDRGPSVTDVLIDSSGVLFATISFMILFVFIRFYINKYMMNNTTRKTHFFNI